MQRERRVLVIDDDTNLSNEIVVLLRRHGYFAQSAANIQKTLAFLAEDLFHVLILDIRLEHNDPYNTDGLKLLREFKDRNLSGSLQIIMLSINDKYDYVHTAWTEFGVADFLSKLNYSNKQVLESLEEVFTKKANINLALIIDWLDIADTKDAVLNLAIDDKKVERDTPLQQLIFEELEDLLCRLFHEAKEILINPITPGQSATGVLSVQPFEDGFKNTVIVKFGSLDKIAQEYANFKQYVEGRMGGGRSTHVLNNRQTQHLGGIVYSFVGVAGDPPHDFGTFYRNAHNADIQKVLNNLFNETCDNWYDNKSHLQPINLTNDYQQLLHITPERMEKGLQALDASVESGQYLHFQHLHEDHRLTDPIRTIANRRPFVERTFASITHGDFNPHNIFVDSNNHTWLIDFLRTGRGHILRDLTQLDSVIRFELLTEKDATLDERYQLEKILCSIDHFHQLADLQTQLSTNNTALGKAFATALHLRTLAWQKLGNKTAQHMKEYYIGLLYHALNTLRFYDLPVVQREHALLSASLLADKLWKIA